MTTNQINYLRLMRESEHWARSDTETARHNWATEGYQSDTLAETRRHNVQTEYLTAEQNATQQYQAVTGRLNLYETSRHNLITEAETQRHNVTTENETHRHNTQTEQADYQRNQITAYQAQEQARHNLRSEQIDQMRVDYNFLTDMGNLSVKQSEAEAQNKVREQQSEYYKEQAKTEIKQRDKMDIEMSKIDQERKLLMEEAAHQGELMTSQTIENYFDAWQQGTRGIYNITGSVNNLSGNKSKPQVGNLNAIDNFIGNNPSLYDDSGNPLF